MNRPNNRLILIRAFRPLEELDEFASLVVGRQRFRIERCRNASANVMGSIASKGGALGEAKTAAGGRPPMTSSVRAASAEPLAVTSMPSGVRRVSVELAAFGSAPKRMREHWALLRSCVRCDC